MAAGSATGGRVDRPSAIREGRRADRTQRSDQLWGADTTERASSACAALACPNPRWRGIAWLACGFAGSVAIVWFIVLSSGEIGSKAEWFFGAVVFVVVLVTMWQTLNIQRTAKLDAAEAAERLRTELTAAEERAKRELALTRTLHHAEMDAQRERTRIERASGSRTRECGSAACRVGLAANRARQPQSPNGTAA